MTEPRGTDTCCLVHRGSAPPSPESGLLSWTGMPCLAAGGFLFYFASRLKRLQCSEEERRHRGSGGAKVACEARANGLLGDRAFRAVP